MARRIIGAEEGGRLCDLVRRSSSWDSVLDAFEAEFGWRIKRETAQSYTSRHGVKLADGKVRWELHPEYDEFLRGYVPGSSQREVIDGFERQFGIRLRTAQLKGRQGSLGLHSGTVGGRFAPGSVPANKGLKMTDFVMDEAKLANIRRCQFRKGQEAHNECAVGTEREGKPTCAECVKMHECCCDYGICEIEFDDAFWDRFDGTEPPPSDVAHWALPWVADHMRDMQEEACAMFCD